MSYDTHNDAHQESHHDASHNMHHDATHNMHHAAHHDAHHAQPHAHGHHAHSTENKAVISFGNSFWLVIILVGLFIAALNFIQVESAGEGHDGHNKGHATHEMPSHADPEIAPSSGHPASAAQGTEHGEAPATEEQHAEAPATEGAKHRKPTN